MGRSYSRSPPRRRSRSPPRYRSRSPPRGRSRSPRYRSRSPRGGYGRRGGDSPPRRRSNSPQRDGEEYKSIDLDDGNVAYLLGRGGQTRARLSNFCGASLEISNGKAEMWGTKQQVELATLAIDITLAQRNGGRIDIDFSELEERHDAISTEVPMDAVGFVLGAKGNTLRTLETRFKTFMFFDNDKVRDNKDGKRSKRLYIISSKEEHREAALREVEDVVRFHATRESHRGGKGGYGGGGGGYGGGYDRRSPPRRRRSYSRSPPRRRSYSRSPRR